MSKIVPRVRCFWRTVKADALSGGLFARCLVWMLKGVARRIKRTEWTRDLADRSLWLMYHPECGILPCDGWKADGLPELKGEDVDALRMRYADDKKHCEQRLHVIEWADFHIQERDMQTEPRVAIHLHVFHPKIAKRIVAAIASLSIHFDMFVSVPEEVAWLDDDMKVYFQRHLPNMERIKIVRCPNKGRDIAPMICAFGSELAGYDVIAHVHTKRSVQFHKDVWLNHILESLFSRTAANEIVSVLSNGVGMVIPPDFLPMQEDPTGWMHNLDKAEWLAKKAHLDLNLRKDFTPCIFPQGFMFWARGDYMKKFLMLPLTFDDFEDEPIGVDGSLAHALERMPCIIGSATGMPVLRRRTVRTDLA